MRTSHKAKDAAAEKQSYVCDTFTGHGKARQPPLPGSPVRVFPVMLPGKAGEGATVDPERGGGGDDAAGDRAQNSGPAAIPQQGTFADDRAWAESADVNPDAEHTVEKKVDVVAGWPCSVSSAPLAILPIAGLLPPRMTRHPGFSGSSMAGSYAWRGTTLSVSTTPRPH
jgi:hypothetical protein